MSKKVVFMGTPQIAVPSLQALINAGFEIPLVVSQPDRPKGRGNQVQMPPVKELALKYGIPVLQPEKIKGNEEFTAAVSSLKPDFFAVVAYGRILPQYILDIPKYASVNVHFSLLPSYRGAAPVNWAILNGDEYTGVTTMKMDSGMDTGDILLVEKTPILRKTAVDIAEELSITGAELLVKTLNEFESLQPQKQPAEGSHAPMMKKEDGLIDWDKPADYIERMIRAFMPWPAVYTKLDGKILKIFAADIAPSCNAEPAKVVQVTKESFTVGTSSGGLIIQEVQLEGKKRMKVSDFLSGFKLTAGTEVGK